MNRKVANCVPRYMRKVAGEAGQMRFDTVTSTERAINMRFKFASRRLRVPHVYPGYFVAENVKQATLTGSEHRRALQFLPFAVVGVAGPPGDEEEHRLLLRCICELVALTNSLSSTQHAARGGMSIREATALARKAHEWVVDHFQPVLGPAHNTKLHRLSAHILDEFRLRGTHYDGGSAASQKTSSPTTAVHKAAVRRQTVC